MKKGTNEPTLSDVLKEIGQLKTDLFDMFDKAGIKDGKPQSDYSWALEKFPPEPEHDFKVGDTVEGISEVDKKNIDGKKGVVCCVYSDKRRSIGVDFREGFGGQYRNGSLIETFWIVAPENLRKITEPK